MVFDPNYFLSEAKKRVRSANWRRGLYFLLKLKGIIETFRIAVSRTKVWEDILDLWRRLCSFLACCVRKRPPLIEKAKRAVGPGRALRGGALVAVFILFLSFGVDRIVPVDKGGGEYPALRPTLRTDAPLPPKIAAKSAYVVDPESGFVFYDKNSLLQLPPASTTKIATALAALEDYELDEAVVVHPSCVLRTGGSIMGLYAGEEITVQNLLRGMLIASAGDAACTLAMHHPGGMLEFIAEMNASAAALGLQRTYFVNPSGMDSTHQYATAQELTLLAQRALGNRFIRETVATKEIRVTSVDGRSWHYLKSTNKLLGAVPGIAGVKTGYTAEAKGVFVFYFRREGKELLGAVMGSDDRFADAETLLKWVLASFFFP